MRNSRSDQKEPTKVFGADIQQAIAFLLNISALKNNAIEVGTTLCFAQGWFVSTGDLASSVFICAIALHTFLAVMRDYRMPSVVFYSWIAGLWGFVYLMALLGPVLHREDFYVRAAAWVCFLEPASPTLQLIRSKVLDQRRLPKRSSLASLLLDLHLHVQHHSNLRHHICVATISLLRPRYVESGGLQRNASHGPLPYRLHCMYSATRRRSDSSAGRA